MIAPKDAIDEEEQQRYLAAYCGLCKTIGTQYGQISRFALTYDMVFLELLLGSLYEPLESYKNSRCIAHPTKIRPWMKNGFDSYAADLTVALVYFKQLDDWHDENSTRAKIAANILRSSYKQISQKIPRQCKVIEEQLSIISKAEAQKCDDPDEMASYFGILMGELFIMNEDEWSPALRRFGNYLGRFIYLMDALCDIDEDVKKGHYNPFVLAGIDCQSAYNALMIYIGKATAIFEKLPLERDLHLMRSILYSGVWQRYNNLKQIQAKDEAKKEARTNKRSTRLNKTQEQETANSDG